MDGVCTKVFYKGNKRNVELLERETRSLQDEASPILKNSEEVISCYDEAKTIARGKIEKVSKTVPTSFFEIFMCKSKSSFEAKRLRDFETEMFW